MNLDWQTITSLIVVALALVGILRHFGKSISASAPCGGCHSCAKNEQPMQSSLVQVKTDSQRS